jgi:hypothetical protein
VDQDGVALGELHRPVTAGATEPLHGQDDEVVLPAHAGIDALPHQPRPRRYDDLRDAGLAGEQVARVARPGHPDREPVVEGELGHFVGRPGDHDDVVVVEVVGDRLAGRGLDGRHPDLGMVGVLDAAARRTDQLRPRPHPEPVEPVAEVVLRLEGLPVPA